MTGPALSVAHDGMGICCRKVSLSVAVTAVTGQFHVGRRQSITAKIGAIVAIYTSTLLHRPVNGLLQKELLVRSMGIVALRAPPVDGIASVPIPMTLMLQVMAGGTEGLLVHG